MNGHGCCFLCRRIDAARPQARPTARIAAVPKTMMRNSWNGLRQAEGSDAALGESVIQRMTATPAATPACAARLPVRLEKNPSRKSPSVPPPKIPASVQLAFHDYILQAPAPGHVNRLLQSRWNLDQAADRSDYALNLAAMQILIAQQVLDVL